MRAAVTPERAAASRALHRVASFAAGRYVSGPDVSDALRTHDRLTHSGCATTLAYWDPAGEPPARVCAIVEETIGSLAGADAEVSLKFPALGFDRDHMTRIAEVAAERAVGLHADSHGHENAERQLRLLDDLATTGTAIGTTLPGRWVRSVDDARALREAAICLRVVKGQWPDPVDPARDARAGFAEVVECLAGRSGRVAVATHDAPLAYESLLRLQEAGTPCELQILYGLPSGPALAVARGLAVPVRIYVPFGCGYLPYTLRQARANPRIAARLGRDLLLRAQGHDDYQQKPPAPSAHQTSVDRLFAHDASCWNDIYGWGDVQSNVYRRRAAVALSWVDEVALPKGARVLEVGCGTGHTAVRLAERGLNVTATDTVAEMVQRTRAAGNGHRLDARVADVHALPFASDSFDLVLGLGVLPWLHSPARAVAEIARVLVAGGHLVLTADNAGRLVDLLDPMFNPWLARARRVGERVAARAGTSAARSVQHRPEDVDRMLASAGFSVARSATVGFGPITFMRRELLPDRAGLAVDRGLQRAADRGDALLARRGRYYIVMARLDAAAPAGKAKGDGEG